MNIKITGIDFLDRPIALDMAEELGAKRQLGIWSMRYTPFGCLHGKVTKKGNIKIEYRHKEKK